MKKLIIGFSSLCLMLVSCKNGNSKFPGYDLTETGFYFKMEKEGTAKGEVKKGDVVFLRHIICTDRDSVLYDYKKQGRPGEPFVVQLSQSMYKGDFFEALMKMKVGDSASFALRVDSFFSKFSRQPVPKFLDSTGYIVYHVKIDSMYGAAKVAEIEKKREERKNAYMEKARLAEDSTLQKYLTDNKITVKPTESGMYIVIKEKGKGKKIKEGDPVEVKYKGTLTNGQEFDASDKHEQAFVFPAGAKKVIPAWDEALLTMNEGTKALLVCPSKLAYGPNGQGPIPPYSPLVFELEVVAIKSDKGK